MYGAYDYPGDNIMNNPNYYSMLYTDEIFKAFVDAIIPRTPELAEEYGKLQYYGALDLYTDEYLIMSLNHFYTPIAYQTAELLEVAAEQLILNGGIDRIGASDYTEWSAFGTLAPMDRLWAITLLEQLMVNVTDLPLPFQNNPVSILYMTNVLNRLTLMGYYSEWSGYGSTRLASPNQRHLEYFPLSWEQVGYPGPSLGYRALRVNNMQSS